MSATTARAVIEDPRDPPATVSTPTISGLFAVWSALVTEAEEVGDRCSDATEAAEELYPEPPTSIRGPKGLAVSRELLKSWGCGPTSKAMMDYDHWDAQCAAIESSFGLPGLKDQLKRSWARVLATAAELLPIRPRTPQEAAMKYRVIQETANDLARRDAARMFENFQADLDHLARRA